MLQTSMTARTTPFADLSDDQLLAEVQRLAAAERCATAALIRSLIELDTRPHLYLREGCSSLYIYCTRVLYLAEGSTYNRIEVARAARRFPMVLEALEDGALTLTAARLLAPHLTEDNQRDLLVAAKHRTKSEVEQLVASLRPKSDVRPVIRKLPQARQMSLATSPQTPRTDAEGETSRRSPSPVVPERPSRTTVAPLSSERYKVELTISRETRDKLRRVQELLRHTVPSGGLPQIFDRALTSLLEELERRRFAQTSAPRTVREGSPSRRIPAAVRREVWRRDEGRCAFVGTRGRCAETSFLEFHHVEPYAVGGNATVENIQLRCRAHNQYEARLFFGCDDVDVVRETPALWQ